MFRSHDMIGLGRLRDSGHRRHQDEEYIPPTDCQEENHDRTALEAPSVRAPGNAVGAVDPPFLGADWQAEFPLRKAQPNWFLPLWRGKTTIPCVCR
jgi:hypothetical protein